MVLLLAAAAAITMLRAGGALADPCPGADACPYSSVAVIGDRDGGVLRLPQAVGLAPDGTVYVADQYTHAIQAFAPDGTFKLAFGILGSGDGQLGAVGGLAVGSDGTIYVVDSTNNRIQRFAPDGSKLVTPKPLRQLVLSLTAVATATGPTDLKTDTTVTRTFVVTR